MLNGENNPASFFRVVHTMYVRLTWISPIFISLFKGLHKLHVSVRSVRSADADPESFVRVVPKLSLFHCISLYLTEGRITTNILSLTPLKWQFTGGPTMATGCRVILRGWGRSTPSPSPF